MECDIFDVIVSYSVDFNEQERKRIAQILSRRQTDYISESLVKLTLTDTRTDPNGTRTPLGSPPVVCFQIRTVQGDVDTFPMSIPIESDCAENTQDQ